MPRIIEVENMPKAANIPKGELAEVYLIGKDGYKYQKKDGKVFKVED